MEINGKRVVDATKPAKRTKRPRDALGNAGRKTAASLTATKQKNETEY